MECNHASATGEEERSMVDRGAVQVLGSPVWVVSHLWRGLPSLPLWVSLALPHCMLSCAVPQLVYWCYDHVSTGTRSQFYRPCNSTATSTRVLV